MKRALCASWKYFICRRRELLVTDVWNYNWSCRLSTMHKGGVRYPYKSTHCKNDGGRERYSRHPSGLSGKEIGLWYAAKGKRKREFQQRANVTIASHHEERINQLLDEFRAVDVDSVSETSNEAGPSSRDCDDLEFTLRSSESSYGEPIKVEQSYSDIYVDGRSPPMSSYFPFAGCIKPDPVLDKYLQEQLQYKQRTGDTEYAAMQKFRERLPSYPKREELLELIDSEQVLVISGETGCGKTTQVAQFILDDAIMKGHGSSCRIICTQPRRISAISVAERVAVERGEKCGDHGSVGFQIRLESKLPRQQGSILYCTTGVLLRWLISDPLLANTSHIILDEIHERDVLSDFLIIVSRDLLPHRPDLKLILMSATLNAEMFSAYFGNCKMTHIPGFTYPVQELYLEDVIEMTGYEAVPKMDTRRKRHVNWRERGRKSSAKDRRLEKFTAWMSEEGHGEDGDTERQQYLSSLRGRFSSKTITTLQNMDLERIDQELLVKVITHISVNMKEGAILCFLPGWEDISKLYDNLKNQKLFSSEMFRIIPLHSMMPSTNQKEVFDRPPPGVRKIVIATNIAETSITIDDVVYVVDAGQVKEKSYDVNNNIACLEPVWISKASSRQRRGRAGRVQPGYCFHLFTTPRAQSLDDYQLPEMLRTPLEELCLQIKILELGKIRPFLSKAMQPPEEQAVVNALAVLHQLKALDANEELTPLGYHLATLPVNPRIGKIILLGAIFSCLDPVLTVASVLGFKDPFYMPLGKKIEAGQARCRFAGNSRSDHIALLNAFQGWEQSVAKGGDRDYCWRNFLSSNTLRMIQDMKKQFSQLLHEIGFLDSAAPKATNANYNSGNMKLVKAVLCAGLYPNVAKIQHHGKLKHPPKLFTQQNGRVHLHPKSVNAEVKLFEDNWLIYHEKMKSTKLFLYDSTMISPFPLLFFGGDISVFVEEGFETVAVDEFIKFKSPTRVANLVKELRVELDKLLKQKIARPEMKLSAGTGTGTGSKESALLRAIIDLITTEENTSLRRKKALVNESPERHRSNSDLGSDDLMQGRSSF